MKVLLVSPHMDDEVLSCASFLLDKSNQTTIFYHSSTHPHFSKEELMAENVSLLNYLGHCAHIISDYNDVSDLLDTLPIRNLVGEFEQLLYSGLYDTILLPNPSYNQDHRQLYEAALTACRPHDRIPFIKRVLVYEEPETFGTLRNVNKFNPTYFRAVDIEEKIKLYHFYKSQHRPHRSDNHLRSIAVVRGIQSNCEYAEAFEILRWVE